MVHGGRGYNVGRSKVNCNLTVYVLEGYWAIRSHIRERAFGCPYSVLVRIALLLDVSLLGNTSRIRERAFGRPYRVLYGVQSFCITTVGTLCIVQYTLASKFKV